MESYRAITASDGTYSPTAKQVKVVHVDERATQQSESIAKGGLKVALCAAGCAAVTVLTPALLQGVANGAVVAAAKLPSLVVPLLSGLMGVALLGAFATALLAAIGKLAGSKESAAYASLLGSAAFGKLRRLLQAGAVGSIAFCGLIGATDWVYSQLGALGLNTACYGGSQVAFWLLGIVFALALVGLGIFAVLLNMKSMGNAGFLTRALLALLALALLPLIATCAAIILLVGISMAFLTVSVVIAIACLPIALIVLGIAHHR